MRYALLLILGLGISCAANAWAGTPNPEAYSPYTKAQFPKIFATWGAKSVAKINKLRKAAVLKAAESSACDNVEYADLSDNRSVPKSSIVIFVDCTNSQRFYFTEADLADDTAAESETSKSARISDSVVRERCNRELRAALKFPSSYNPSIWNTSIYRAPQTGNIVVTVDFEAKNGLGLAIPQRGRCYFDSRGFKEVEIADR